LRPAAFRDFHARTTRSHVALCERNSGAESGRELFKGSKRRGKSSSLYSKKVFWLGGMDFLWVTS